MWMKKKDGGHDVVMAEKRWHTSTLSQKKGLKKSRCTIPRGCQFKITAVATFNVAVQGTGAGLLPASGLSRFCPRQDPHLSSQQYASGTHFFNCMSVSHERNKGKKTMARMNLHNCTTLHTMVRELKRTGVSRAGKQINKDKKHCALVGQTTTMQSSALLPFFHCFCNRQAANLRWRWEKPNTVRFAVILFGWRLYSS